jgi:serine/threonine protein kinase
MVVCNYPFGHDGPGGQTTRAVLDNIRRGVFRLPQTASSGLQDLVKGMLAVNPAQRLTINQIQAHPWVREGWEMESQEPTGMDDPAHIDWSSAPPAPPQTPFGGGLPSMDSDLLDDGFSDEEDQFR